MTLAAVPVSIPILAVIYDISLWLYRLTASSISELVRPNKPLLESAVSGAGGPSSSPPTRPPRPLMDGSALNLDGLVDGPGRNGSCMKAQKAN